MKKILTIKKILTEPENPALHHEVGRLYQVLGKDKQSERWFLSALHRSPTYRPSHEALAELYARRKEPGDAARAEQHRRLAQAVPR